MLVLGIDPGPRDASWAIVESEESDLVSFGHIEFPDSFDAEECEQAMTGLGDIDCKVDAIAIENVFAPVKGDQRIKVKHVVATAMCVGMLRYLVQKVFPDVPVILIHRAEMKGHLPGGSVRWRDAQVNRCLATLVPKLRHKPPGLTNHNFAAAAVAYVAPGVLKARRMEEMLQ